MDLNIDGEYLLNELVSTEGCQGLSPALYHYYAGIARREIIFNGDVDRDIVESVTVPLLLFEQDNSDEPVTLIITTDGGEIYHGMAVCDIIDNYSKPLNIIILGNAFSMGTLLAMAGKDNPNVKKKCYKHTVFLIHDGSFYLGGNLDRVRDGYLFKEKYELLIDNYILSHTTISQDMYDKQKNHDWYLTADEALAFGIVDEVVQWEKEAYQHTKII